MGQDSRESVIRGKIMRWLVVLIMAVMASTAHAELLKRLSESNAFSSPCPLNRNVSPGQSNRPVKLVFANGFDFQVDVEKCPVTSPETRFVLGELHEADKPLGLPEASAVNLYWFQDVSGLYGKGFIAIAGEKVAGILVAEHNVQDFKGTVACTGELLADTVIIKVDDLLGKTHKEGEAFFGQSLLACRTQEFNKDMFRLQLAVDTDYELFALFDDMEFAAAYVTLLYGVVNEIYMRDLNTRIELTYVRLWDTPVDLFNEPDPFVPFVSYWSSQMSHVQRDSVQLLTGRWDVPFTGKAYMESLCNNNRSCSVVGGIGGFQRQAEEFVLDDHDIVLAAHELAHVCGARHTHDYGLDDCAPSPGVESRGTIMSYCSSHNGGYANIDLRFHRVIQNVVKNYIAQAACVDLDCNRNGQDDTLDIVSGTSEDADTNGIPDECEDCNNNGVLDGVDIAQGTPDYDVNGIPDECQSDCNSNGIPDSLDIAGGTSFDDDGDTVPDECATDCDMNGIADLIQIGQSLDLDVNRNRVLDSCEDCDGDGTDDAAELAGAHALWVASADQDVIRRFHGETGGRSVISQGTYIEDATDLVVTPTSKVLVSSCTMSSVAAYDGVSGVFTGMLVPKEYGGLSCASGITWKPSSRILVSSRDTDSVLMYAADTGTCMGEFISAGSGGLEEPGQLVFGPDGNLFVCSLKHNAVFEYDGNSGEFVRVFVHAGAGGLENPRALLFLPNGNLLVASYGSRRILEYDRWSGDYLGVFNHVLYNNGQEIPVVELAIGPGGNVFAAACDGGDSWISEYDCDDGRFVRAFVDGYYSGLGKISGLAFMPGFVIDCDKNLIPDNCDIDSNPERDANSNGTLDYCETDCNSNGVWDYLELIPRGSLFDCDFNGIPDDCDIASGAAVDLNDNQVPDVCERYGDCNSNGVRDIFDIYEGTSSDCDNDGIPDTCEDDCDGNGIADTCEILSNLVPDCNFNGVPDHCDLAEGNSQDFDDDGLLDECDGDIDNDGIPNEQDVCDFSLSNQELNPHGGPMGDADNDCEVTVSDFYYLEFCLTISGPDLLPTFDNCLQVFDFDCDSDIDLMDFAAYDRVFLKDAVYKGDRAVVDYLRLTQWLEGTGKCEE